MIKDIDEHLKRMGASEILRFPGHPRRDLIDDCAGDEYVIAGLPSAPSGLVVYARYPDGWEANSGERGAIWELLRRLGTEVPLAAPPVQMDLLKIEDQE